MTRLGDMLTKHRNAFLLGLLITTLVVSGVSNRKADRPASVEIPVTEVFAQPVSAVEAFRQHRDQAALSDIAALERLCAQDSLDDQTREDAADQLRTIIDARQTQQTLEGALIGSSLYPCAAVVHGGSVTIVTEKSAITEKDSALVLTLAAAHAGVMPENVRIIPANSADFAVSKP